MDDDERTGTRGMTTAILHADRAMRAEHGAVRMPMHAAVAYGYASTRELVEVFQGVRAGHVYGRQGNPTDVALEAKIDAMEGTRGTVCFATGMAAIAAVLVALLRGGDHLVASRYLFGNTASLLHTLDGLGVDVSLADATDADAVRAALRPTTRMMFVETIANPRTQVADLARLGALCREHGLLYVVDNTMTTPWLFQPRTVGAGLVVNSLTKSIGGHGDALGGAVSDTGLFDWTRYPNVADAYRRRAPHEQGLLQLRKRGLRDMGGTLPAEHAHRIASGAETLALRLERACDNAERLARLLDAHPAVARVHYPGLQSHAQHARARTLFRRFGALLAFETADGVDPFAVLDALQLVVRSSHLGDNRTLALPPAHTIFWEMGAEQRAAMGIADGLIRVSVGIEDADDLLADFAQALDRAAPQ